jgi:hypothetical protein
MPQELRWFTITHFIELEGAQPIQKFSLQRGVGVSQGWGGDEVVHLFCVPLVQLRYYVVKFGRLVGNAGQRKLSVGLGEPDVGQLGPERRKAFSYWRYFRRLRGVCVRGSSRSTM